jgi:hypothetical protein
MACGMELTATTGASGKASVAIPSLSGNKNTYNNINYSFSSKAKQAELGTSKFGYNIQITMMAAGPNNPVHKLYLRIVNSQTDFMKGKLLYSNGDVENVTGIIRSSARARVSRIFDHRACDSVVSLGLEKVNTGTIIDKIHGDDEVFGFSKAVRESSNEAVEFKIVGLDSDDEIIHRSESFNITFMVEKCGDSKATNEYSFGNNIPKDSECIYAGCTDSDNCNYDEFAPNGGSWVHDQSLCYEENSEGDCCPQLNACGDCGDLNVDHTTGKCTSGDKSGECPSGMVEDRCGNCFDDVTSAGYDECVGCMVIDNTGYDSNATVADVSLCEACLDESACNYDSTSGGIHNQALCEIVTFENITIDNSYDVGYTRYNDIKVSFESNIFTKEFTAADVAGIWTMGDIDIELKAPEGDAQEGNVVGGMKWKLYDVVRTLSDKDVSGANWTIMQNTGHTGRYNMTIQMDMGTIYYVLMSDYFSNPMSAENPVGSYRTEIATGKLGRKGATTTDIGAGCLAAEVDYLLEREVEDSEGNKTWTGVSTGTKTTNAFTLISSAPGKHRLSMKPDSATEYTQIHEFDVMIDDVCIIEGAENYVNMDSTYVKGVQNGLDADGYPIREGLCKWRGCTDDKACNYSQYFTFDDGKCALPDYGKDCNDDCLKNGA